MEGVIEAMWNKLCQGDELLQGMQCPSCLTLCEKLQLLCSLPLPLPHSLSLSHTHTHTQLSFRAERQEPQSAF